MGYHLTEKIRSEFSRSRTPVVLAGTVDVEHQLPSVNIDYKQATIDAVSYLLKENEKIAFVSGPLVDDINGKVRLIGYKEALKKQDILIARDWSLNQNTAMTMVMPWQNA